MAAKGGVKGPKQMGMIAEMDEEYELISKLPAASPEDPEVDTYIAGALRKSHVARRKDVPVILDARRGPAQREHIDLVTEHKKRPHTKHRPGGGVRAGPRIPGFPNRPLMAVSDDFFARGTVDTRDIRRLYTLLIKKCSYRGLEYEEPSTKMMLPLRPGHMFFPNLSKLDVLLGNGDGLPLLVPDTIVHYKHESLEVDWLFTSATTGLLTRRKVPAEVNGAQKLVLELFRHARPDYPVCIVKYPDENDIRLGNRVELLTWMELKEFFDRNGFRGNVLIQRFIPPAGPHAYLVRSVYEGDDLPMFSWVLSNKSDVATDFTGRVVKGRERERALLVPTRYSNAVSVVRAKGVYHYQRNQSPYNTPQQITRNLALYMGSMLNVKFELFVCDFIKDARGTWWFIQVKAFRVAKKHQPSGDRARSPDGSKSPPQDGPPPPVARSRSRQSPSPIEPLASQLSLINQSEIDPGRKSALSTLPDLVNPTRITGDPLLRRILQAASTKGDNCPGDYCLQAESSLMSGASLDVTEQYSFDPLKDESSNRDIYGFSLGDNYAIRGLKRLKIPYKSIVYDRIARATGVKDVNPMWILQYMRADSLYKLVNVCSNCYRTYIQHEKRRERDLREAKRLEREKAREAERSVSPSSHSTARYRIRSAARTVSTISSVAGRPTSADVTACRSAALDTSESMGSIGGKGEWERESLYPLESESPLPVHSTLSPVMPTASASISASPPPSPPLHTDSFGSPVLPSAASISASELPHTTSEHQHPSPRKPRAHSPRHTPEQSPRHSARNARTHSPHHSPRNARAQSPRRSPRYTRVTSPRHTDSADLPASPSPSGGDSAERPRFSKLLRTRSPALQGQSLRARVLRVLQTLDRDGERERPLSASSCGCKSLSRHRMQTDDGEENGVGRPNSDDDGDDVERGLLMPDPLEGISDAE
eukprot:Rmarinus@m.14501